LASLPVTTLKIELPPKLIPLFHGPAMYRNVWGGRGSAKTRSMAKMTAVKGRMFGEAGQTGLILCCRQFMNSLSESSFSEIQAAIASEPWLNEYYELGEKYIRSRDGRISYDFVGLARNIDSIKSKSRILLNWNDEADPISAEAWEKLDPTIREEGAEIWNSWNPENRKSATHLRFRVNPPPMSKGVELNWRDNPWFPSTLEIKRKHSQETDPDNYDHIWEGDFKTFHTGAYFKAFLTKAKQQGRITKVSADPLLRTLAIWDIGGTGKKSDATSIWIVQFVGREIRILDCYEDQGQPLAAQVNWLRDRGWERAHCILPHDGVQGDKVFAVSYESSLRAAGFHVTVIKNQGPGAAMLRVQAVRRLADMFWFNEATTEAGRNALAYYHPKYNEAGNDMGPDHDWASHFADAFGLMAIHYETPRIADNEPKHKRRAIL
jgi:phage terminase large subunit